MTISYIEVCGFRSYGAQPQRIELTAPLTVVHADNSQGKTSLAEAFEFLHTGTISRRQLGGGSPGEFEGSLRNAHIDSGVEVYVEVGLLGPDGAEVTIRRTLDADYRGATDCGTTLTANGLKIESVTSVGLQLSDPPLASPVLLEHALRYAVSAKPGDRSDYFKALLEVADLDSVRTEIASLIAEREGRPRESLVQKLDSLAAIPTLPSLPNSSQTTSEEQLTNSLLAALNAIAPSAADETPGAQPITSAITRVQNELASRQNSLVPVDELRPGRNPQPEIRIRVAKSLEDVNAELDEIALFDQLSDYNVLANAVERSVADVLPLLRTALSTDAVAQHDGDNPIDCPLCETPGALTPERLQAIRQQVADQEGLTQAGSSIRTAVLTLDTDLAMIAEWSARISPIAASWPDEQRGAHSQTILQFGGSTQLFDAAATNAALVKDARDKLSVRIESAHAVHARIADRLERLVAVPETDIAELATCDAAVRQSLAQHASAVERSAAASDACIADVEPRLSELSATDGWSNLIEVSANAELVWQSIVRQRNADTCTARLKAAHRVVVSAIKKVLDRKLELMADEIRKWWSLMRPNELTVFDRISRRGSGNRYLDLTASLVPEPAGDGVIRNALAVLSNSQLNALGLATFLARCQLLGSPVIFLDDPVPGSDREHRYTFAGAVITEMLQTGRQLVVTTHDAELARTLQTLHQHLGIGEYSANLLDPRVGTQIVRSGDDFERLMLDASSQMNSPLIENRRAAGNSLRIATERLAKHILVEARLATGEADASLVDYDNKNLKDLRPLVVAYAQQPDEPGRWAALARILNDADHDTTPPQPADLKTCYDMLRELKKRHKVRTLAGAN